MADLLSSIKQLVAEIVLRANTRKGADEAVSDFEKVGESADNSATLLEKNTKITESAERAYERLKRRLDPLAAAQERLQRDQEALSRALEFGAIKSVEEYDKRLEQLNAEHARTEERIKRTQRAQQGLNREFDLMKIAGAAAAGALAGVFSIQAAQRFFDTILRGAPLAVAALDEIAKKARSLGGIDESGFLQESRFALGQLGYNEAGADKLISDFQRRVGQYQLGTGELGTLLTRTDGGAELGAALKNARTLQEQFDVALAKLNEVEDASKRAALAGALFGEEAAKNIGALAEAGVDGFNALREEARAAGLVIEEDVLQRSEEMNDRYSKASQIIGVQMKKAFSEVAPVIVGLIELSAELISRTAEGLRNLRLQYADPEKVQDRTELEAIKRQTEERISSRQTEFQTYALRAPAVNADAVAAYERDLAKLRGRLDEVNAALFKMDALSVTSTDQLREALSGASNAAGDVIESLENLRKKRDEVLARLEAARGGKGAIETFDAKQEIDNLVEASGLVGEQAKEYRRVAEEIQAAQGELDSLIAGYGKAKDTAAAVKFDPIGDVQTQNERLQKLIDAAAISPQELEATERRFDIEDQIARVKLDAARIEKTLTDKEIEALEEKLTLNRQLNEEFNRLKNERGGASARDFAAPYRRELFDVAFDFVHMLGRGDLSGFRDLAKRMKNILLNAVIDPFANAFGNIFSGLFNGVGGVYSAGGYGTYGANPAGAIFTPGVLGGGYGAAAAGGVSSFGLGGLGGLAGLAPLALVAGGSALGGAASVFGLGGALGFGAGSSLTQNVFAEGVVRQLGGLVGLGNSPLLGSLGEAVGTAFSPVGALGGIGGSLLSGALFGQSKAQSIGSTIGGIAGSFIPIPFLGNLIGSFIGGTIGALFAGKPSNNVGQIVFDPETGAIKGTGQKNTGAAANDNFKIAENIQSNISDAVTAVVDVTGGTIRDLASTSYRDDLINVLSGDRTNIVIGNQGANGEIANAQTFDKTEEGAQAAIEAGVRLALKNLDTPYDAIDRYLKAKIDTLPIEDLANDLQSLTGLFKEVEKLPAATQDIIETFVNASLDANRSVEKTVETAGAVAAVLAPLAEPVDAYTQAVNDLKDAVDPLIADFKSLGLSTKELKDAYDAAVGALADKANEENAAALKQYVNPEKAAVEEIIKAQDARRQGLQDVAGAGGNVDFTLLDRVDREQILSQFNIADRLAAASDPVKYQIDQMLAKQAREREALVSAVDNVRIFASDVDALDRAQSLERTQAFSALSTEDKLRLSGKADEFEDLIGSYGVLLDRFNEEIKRQKDAFADTVAGLEDTVADRSARALDAGKLIQEFDRIGRQQTPGAELQNLRDQALQLSERVKDPNDVLARDTYLQVLQDLVTKSQSVNVSSAAFTSDFEFARSLAVDYKALLESEGDAAEQQLAAIERNGDLLEDIIALMSAPTLDVEAFAAAAAGLDPANPLAPIAVEIVRLQAAQSEQNDRLVAILSALTPQDVGLGADAAPSSAQVIPLASAAPPSPANPDNIGVIAQAGAQAAAGSKTTSREADIIDGLFTVAHAIDAQTTQDLKLAKEQKKRDDAALQQLKLVANKR